MIVHFSRLTPAACGDPAPFSFTHNTEEVTCETCRAMLKKRHGIRWPEQRNKKEPQKEMSL
jgi:hypothetical protein